MNGKATEGRFLKMNELPLQNIRVVDLSQIMAGPYCTMVLGDLGADVIKIEKINGGDDSRQMGPYINGESACFMQINRNKRSVALDLKDSSAREIFYTIARNADILVENFRPGVTQSLHVDYETISAFNPGITYCSISGYGQTGPLHDKGGFDLVAQGATGLMSITGETGRRPVKAGVAVYDIGSGITAVYSILAAYIYSKRTGHGQHIDIALAECGIPWFTWEAAAYFSNGKELEPTGWRHRVSAPYQSFMTRNGFIVLGCANQRTWENLCSKVMNHPEWIRDPRFATNSKRHENIEMLEPLIEAVLKTNDTDTWVARCDEAGVPAGPIRKFSEAMQDPQYLARGMIQSFEHPKAGHVKTLGFASKFSETPPSIRRPSPLLGQHTDEVLSEFGVNKETLQDLHRRGVVA